MKTIKCQSAGGGGGGLAARGSAKVNANGVILKGNIAQFGSYSLDPGQQGCQACPSAGADCPGGAAIVPLPGWWHSAVESVQMHTGVLMQRHARVTGQHCAHALRMLFAGAPTVATMSCSVLLHTRSFLPYGPVTPGAAYGLAMGAILLAVNLVFVCSVLWQLLRLIDWPALSAAFSKSIRTVCRRLQHLGVSVHRVRMRVLRSSAPAMGRQSN
ncbi:hypothetical protein OEZ86_012497 [Tetradesmus obliquus]|nr:hypothetical protein OEZ86_012497 [Tetradesmus obliquus]